jgi:hypothetical protein
MRQQDLFRLPTKPWKAGRLIGPNCALDAKLRACDLVKLSVRDVAPGGVLRERSTVIQQKTGRPVPFEITEPMRDALRAWLSLRSRQPRFGRPQGHEEQLVARARAAHAHRGLATSVSGRMIVRTFRIAGNQRTAG